MAKAPSAEIEFNFQTKIFDLNTRKISHWISQTLKEYNKKKGDISIIFCDDQYVLSLNRTFLNHDYYTDIITFPQESLKISGELYISIDRVKENAIKFDIDFDLELLRVIIHGIFHLLGYNDYTQAEKENMRKLEEKALKSYQDEFLKKEHYYDQVYDVVRLIPKGRVTNYGAIADFLALGSARMVGWALNQLKGNTNTVPAHRVVNRNGELTGRVMFGEGGSLMGKLLESEGVKIENHKVKFFDKHFWHPNELV